MSIVIPEKLLVKYQNGKSGLSYITYKDNKGKIAKEKSWTGWGNGQVIEYDNSPKEGFVVTALGKRSADWFGNGRNYFEVKSPDGFIIQITCENLHEIFEISCIKESKIEGKCQFSFYSGSLWLTHEKSETYVEKTKEEEEAKKLTEAKKATKMIPGVVLKNQYDQKMVYLGKIEQTFRRAGKDNIQGKFSRTHMLFMGKNRYDKMIMSTYSSLPKGYVGVGEIEKIDFEKFQSDFLKAFEEMKSTKVQTFINTDVKSGIFTTSGFIINLNKKQITALYDEIFTALLKELSTHKEYQSELNSEHKAKTAYNIYKEGYYILESVSFKN